VAIFLQETSMKAGDKQPLDFKLVSCSAYFFTLKMEAIYSSETSVDSQRPSRRYIPKYGTIHNHLFENLKSYKVNVVYKLF
jgi:hypothetical protein